MNSPNQTLAASLTNLPNDVTFKIFNTYNVATHPCASAPLHWVLYEKLDLNNVVILRMAIKDDSGKIHNIRLRNLKEAARAAIHVWKLNGQWSELAPVSLLDRLASHLGNLEFQRPIAERIEGVVSSCYGGFGWWIVEANGQLFGSTDYTELPIVITKVAQVNHMLDLGRTSETRKQKALTSKISRNQNSVLLVWTMMPESVSLYLFPEDHAKVKIIASVSGQMVNYGSSIDDSDLLAVSEWLTSHGTDFLVTEPTVIGNIKAVYTAGWYL